MNSSLLESQITGKKMWNVKIENSRRSRFLEIVIKKISGYSVNRSKTYWK